MAGNGQVKGSSPRAQKPSGSCPPVPSRTPTSASIPPSSHSTSLPIEEVVMNQPATLPHLFGRFTAVMRDHADIGKTLGQMRAMCAALDGGEVALPNELL